jgi:hypothetical protein
VSDSTVAPPPPTLDSVLRPGVRPDSLATPVVAPRGSLVVSAPAGSVLTLNGVSVGTAPWRSDAIPPGRYTVQASLPSSAGCPTATERSTVDVRAGRQRDVHLSPIACGMLALDVRAPDAHYAIVPLSPGGTRTEGSLPLTQPLVLPAGTYSVMITKQYCALFTENVTVTAGMTASLGQVVRLICEREKR